MIDEILKEFDKKFANATYSSDGKGCHCNDIKAFLKESLSSLLDSAIREIKEKKIKVKDHNQLDPECVSIEEHCSKCAEFAEASTFNQAKDEDIKILQKLI